MGRSLTAECRGSRYRTNYTRTKAAWSTCGWALLLLTATWLSSVANLFIAVVVLGWAVMVLWAGWSNHS
jgi:hypothetical protein